MTDAFLRLILADPEPTGRGSSSPTGSTSTATRPAEFIRVQCALARLPRDDRRTPALEGGPRCWSRATSSPGEPLRGLAAKWEFRRGFPEVVDVDARTFLARADELFAAVPVRHARLLDVEGHLPRLSKCEALARLSALTVAASKLGNALPKGRSPCRRT